MKKITLSISLVVYQESFYDIEDCLKSLIYNMPQNITYEIIIIDNNFTHKNKPSSIKEECLRNFPSVSILYILSPKNGGYGYAHNQAIFLSKADYHLIINNDVCVMTDSLKNAFQFMLDNPNIGMLVPDIYDNLGNRVYLCRQNPRLWISFVRRFGTSVIKKLFNKKMATFEMRDKDYNKPIFNLTNPTGCFMFCNLALLKILNGFDEKFFLYYEDADLGRRFAKISRIAYVPSVKIKHEWRRASYQDKRMAWVAIKSAFYYAWKWHWIKTSVLNAIDMTVIRASGNE